MKLFHRKTGEGKPLFILHGLFGSSDNWMTLSKAYAEAGFACYAVDQRNHGRSPHSETFSYPLMAADLVELIHDLRLQPVNLIGHSMGGKTAMFFAQQYPGLTNKIIVADMAPRYYTPHHQSVLSAIRSVDLDLFTSRKQAEEQLRISILDEATVQFLLKNLYWKDDGHLDWRFNFPVLEKEIESVGSRVPGSPQITCPTLFIKGEKSGYVLDSDEKDIRELFSDYRIVSIPLAGHWVHAEQPAEFLRESILFLNS